MSLYGHWQYIHKLRRKSNSQVL